MRVRGRRSVRRAALVAVIAATVIATAGGAAAAPAFASTLPETYGTTVAGGVTASNVSNHLRALQDIADRNGGNRALGTAGYLRSLDYVEARLREAGYAPTRQEFTATMFEEKSHQLSAGGAQIDSQVLGYSGSSAPLTAPVSAVPTTDTTPGCQPGDFPATARGAIVVVDRGVCPFGDKVANAKIAGARAVVIVNTENGPLQGTLGEDVRDPLPAVAVSRDLGSQVRQAGSLTLAVDARTARVKSWNLLAETHTGLPNSVVMLGAHLDSVPEGPGINDNGSGSAAVLQTALAMTALAPVKNKVRFAFWGAEEEGLIGSTHYVETLPATGRASIRQYLNFDMLGSHNGGYFVSDGDGSSHLPDSYAGPRGSGEIERVFTDFLTRRGVGPEPSGFDGRSDYDAFAQAGIATGGIDSGADKVKTPEQAMRWGGTAGEIFDQNYHTARDTFANVNQKVLGTMAPAVAYAAGYFAML
ncbi:M28 family peptidase [Gordonia polyisoprenivorans]|uniref:M28 family peptidase n=1 Tax=Gordonia polyisoprenivorans TaxID=84595 RepID=UPI001AD6C50C|nr:M28 family peptidase [Gordonia polyisoprenivorans]QTI69210.1 M28 family peptidase [Gordonia polyisoprenivorans]